MTSKKPDDLLSAFLDRESTPAEEAAAKSRIQTSPQAKEELQDYARLSEWLHELPRQTVPPEFASAVMQRAERETLIPMEATGAVGRGSHLKPLSRRAWILTAVGAVAAGLAVMLFVPLPGRKDVPVLVDDDAVRQPRRTEVFALADAPPATAAQKPVPAIMGANAVAARSPLGTAAIAAKSSQPRITASSLGYLMPAKPGEGKTAELVFPANLKTARAGDVIEALENVGDQVAVVRLTVVNQTAGLGGLQSLLVRDTSRPVQDREQAKRLQKWFMDKKEGVSVGGQKMANGTGDLICVFMEGSRDQLTGVLKDLQHESQIQQAELTNTISASKLAQYANRPVAPSRQRNETDRNKAQTVLSLPVATVDKILADNRQGASTVGRPAQQGQKERQLVAAAQRSYQVFFVLDDQSIAQSQPAAAPPPAAIELEVIRKPSPGGRRRTPVVAKRPASKPAPAAAQPAY